MADWIDLIAYQRLEGGGKVLHAVISDAIDLKAEAGAHERDIRLVDGDHVIKIRISADWAIQDILVDDFVVWSADEGQSDV